MVGRSSDVRRFSADPARHPGGRGAEGPGGSTGHFAGTSSRQAPWPPNDTGCTVLHVDMDAFYASVEVCRRPELAGLPVVVAGGSSRGVVLSATYQARAFGVRSAMPVARARRQCPQAVFVPPDFARYARVSNGVMAIFRSITPLVQPLSLDEAFLDVGGALRRLGRSPAGVGEEIRARVADEQGIPCSVGVASNLFVAKLASGMAKPDGMLVVPAGAVLGFLRPLPVSALWGVGERTADMLRSLGLETVGDLAAAPLSVLRRAVGAAAATRLLALAQGRDERRVVPGEPEKSVGAEETFEVDVTDDGALLRELLRLSERTAATLRARGLCGRTVSIKVRFADFTTVTRSRTLLAPTDVGQEVYRTAASLLGALAPRPPVRLVGVRVEQLRGISQLAEQPTLDAPEHGRRHAELAADLVRSRFGAAAVRPATLLGAREVPPAGSATPLGAGDVPGVEPATAQQADLG